MSDPTPRPFLTTRWSLVRAARGEGEDARRSLGELCEAYWYPLYAYLRRHGEAHAAAQDAVQGYLAAVLERGDLARLEPELGRFRGWLLAGLRNYASKQRAHDRAQKRGGGRVVLAVDWEDGRARFGGGPASTRTPEQEFDRAWALAALARARARVAADYAERGKAELFAALEPELDPGAPGRDRAELARALDLREGALKVAVHRLRQRFGAALRAEVAETLSADRDVDDELAELMRALGA
ncbi:MAG: hypothetical protein H6828_08970 [Planctomycetes bacterium]|nr:hypothetical protein [Planctomycetota bacterium]